MPLSSTRHNNFRPLQLCGWYYHNISITKLSDSTIKINLPHRRCCSKLPSTPSPMAPAAPVTSSTTSLIRDERGQRSYGPIHPTQRNICLHSNPWCIHSVSPIEMIFHLLFYVTENNGLAVATVCQLRMSAWCAIHKLGEVQLHFSLSSTLNWATKSSVTFCAFAGGHMLHGPHASRSTLVLHRNTTNYCSEMSF